METGSVESLLMPLVGEWDTEATHPLVPGTIVRGRWVFEWMAGQKFMIVRAESDHPDFPDSVSIIGNTGIDRVGKGGLEGDGEGLQMHYFDTRGVYRVYEVRMSDEAWEWSMDAPGWSQRFTCTFEDEGNTMAGMSQLSRDDAAWEDDLQITYRRTRPA